MVEERCFHQERRTLIYIGDTCFIQEDEEYWLLDDTDNLNGHFVLPDRAESFWLKNGAFHREDGPARIWKNGRKSWWVNGEWIKSE